MTNEWWGIWSDIGNGWLLNTSPVVVYHFPSKAIAQAQLGITRSVPAFDKYTDMRIRSFDEWAETDEIAAAVEKFDRDNEAAK